MSNCDAMTWSQVYHDLEMKSLSKYGQVSCQEGLKESNRERNRWCNVIPYDKYRVALKDNSYINASLIKVKETSNTYILTQGPLERTVEHFWTMIVEQKVHVLVMLCKTCENGMEKCHQYWPSQTNPFLKFPNLEIHFVEEENVESAKYIRRTFNVVIFPKYNEQGSEEAREFKVEQFHYHTWPDFGVPDNPRQFLEFIDKVRQSREQHKTEHQSAIDEPILVHCSAGIGRSGAFCLIDTCCTILEEDPEKKLSLRYILDLLLQMREYRAGLVQTWQQLRFAHQAIVEVKKRNKGKNPDPKEAMDDQQPKNGNKSNTIDHDDFQENKRKRKRSN